MLLIRLKCLFRHNGSEKLEERLLVRKSDKDTVHVYESQLVFVRGGMHVYFSIHVPCLAMLPELRSLNPSVSGSSDVVSSIISNLYLSKPFGVESIVLTRLHSL